MYGVYNTIQKEFQFGICEESEKRAQDKLISKIGNDAYKWRFEIRTIKEDSVTDKYKQLYKYAHWR